MEDAIRIIKGLSKIEFKCKDTAIMRNLLYMGYTETEIRYCYVLAIGKNMQF